MTDDATDIHTTFSHFVFKLANFDSDFNLPVFISMFSARFGAIYFENKEILKQTTGQFLKSHYEVNLKEIAHSAKLPTPSFRSIISQMRDAAYWTILDAAQNAAFNEMWHMTTRYQELLSNYSYDPSHGDVLNLVAVLMSRYGNWRFERFFEAWKGCFAATPVKELPNLFIRIQEIVNGLDKADAVSLALHYYIEQNKQYLDKRPLIETDTTFQVNTAIESVEMRDDFSFKVNVIDHLLNSYSFNYKPREGGPTLQRGDIIILTFKRDHNKNVIIDARASASPRWAIFKRIFLNVISVMPHGKMELENSEKNISITVESPPQSNLESGDRVKAVVATINGQHHLIELIQSNN
ncbi:MAG: hypothetical protein K2H61_05490 [Muribaculaceae bacterium]|nr:hypothetical protein [Muribaculaceae bacterium]